MDSSWPAVARLLETAGFEVVAREVVADDERAIAILLRSLADGGVSVVATTGGTGVAARDVTPEATRSVIERDIPGLAEQMRAAGQASTPHAALSRGLAGTIGSSVVVNLPGSESGATESLQAILPALPHAVELLRGCTEHMPQAGGERGGDTLVATAVKVTGTPPCRVGQRMVVSRGAIVAGTLGCAEFDDGALADAPAVLASGEPTTRTYTHDLGSVEVFLDPTSATTTVPLLVLSATPVARALATWGPAVGFDVRLVEPRGERLTPQDHAARLIDLSALDGAAGAAVVATDHEAPYLVDALERVLATDAWFVGVMGSARHVGPHLEELRRRGFDDEALARIRTPVGLDIGARTPEEIALSIVAGVVAARNDAGGGWLDRRG